ncbi:MAG: nitrate reductase molybdenum cofactor assembly chaperone [Planctomycetota bacterium]
MASSSPHDSLAAVWTYPDETYAAKVARARADLGVRDPVAAARLDALVEVAESGPLSVVEELFTRTFDINPVCSLECGWHLYGEDYGRGEFLVGMRRTMRALGVEETTELPDHLTHVLPVLQRLPEEEARRFAATSVVPALRKMLEGFRDADNPYREALEGVLAFVCAVHDVPEEEKDLGAPRGDVSACGGHPPAAPVSSGLE